MVLDILRERYDFLEHRGRPQKALRERLGKALIGPANEEEIVSRRVGWWAVV